MLWSQRESDFVRQDDLTKVIERDTKFIICFRDGKTCNDIDDNPVRFDTASAAIMHVEDRFPLFHGVRKPDVDRDTVGYALKPSQINAHYEGLKAND